MVDEERWALDLREAVEVERVGRAGFNEIGHQLGRTSVWCDIVPGTRSHRMTAARQMACCQFTPPGWRDQVESTGEKQDGPSQVTG